MNKVHQKLKFEYQNAKKKKKNIRNQSATVGII